MATDHDSPDSETGYRAAPAAGLFGAIGRNDKAQRDAEARLIDPDADFAGNFRAGTRTRPSDAPSDEHPMDTGSAAND